MQENFKPINTKYTFRALLALYERDNEPLSFKTVSLLTMLTCQLDAIELLPQAAIVL